MSGFGFLRIWPAAQIGRHDQLHLRIFGADGVCQQRPALDIIRSAVFIADLHVFQIKRRGMTGLRAQTAPHGIGRAIGVFNRIERILNPLPHLSRRHADAIQCHAVIDVEQRFRAEVSRRVADIRENPGPAWCYNPRCSTAACANPGRRWCISNGTCAQCHHLQSSYRRENA